MGSNEEPTRNGAEGTYSPRRLRDFSSQRTESEQPYLRRPRPSPRPRLPILHWIILLVLCLVIYNFGFSKQGIRTLLNLRRSTQENIEREQVLQAEETQLVKDREDLVRGDAVERFARERHHFLGDGEELYIVPRTAPETELETENRRD